MNTATVPVPPFEVDRYSQDARHAQVLEIKDAINPEIVLVGDSITHFWGGEPTTPGAPENGPLSFSRTFGGRRVLNLGYGFDRTQNVLWRFQNGELDALRPRKAVVCIGTNNLTSSAKFTANTPAETVEGIEAVCLELERRCPGVEIILMCIFPRDERPDSPLRKLVRETDDLIVPMSQRHGWTCLDLWDKLLDPDGMLTHERTIDFCHLNESGYAIWGEAITAII